MLQEILSSHKELCLGPLLFRAQLLCAGGSSKEALRLLMEIKENDIRFQGSMVATKITLMEQVFYRSALLFRKLRFRPRILWDVVVYWMKPSSIGKDKKVAIQKHRIKRSLGVSKRNRQYKSSDAS